MRLSWFLLITMVLIPVTLATAQVRTLTLKDAVEIALQQNISVIQAQNNVDAAHSGVLQAYGNYLPTLSANGGWTRRQNWTPIYDTTGARTGQAITGLGNSFDAGLSANLTLFDGLNREASLGRANSTSTSAEQSSTRTRQSIVNSVQNSYLTVLRNQELVKVNEENLRRDQKQLERIQESSRVGALSMADVYRQQSQVAGDEYTLILSQNTFDKSKADLASLIGLNTATDYAFVDPSMSTEIDSTEFDTTMSRYTKPDQLLQRALTSRPDYISAREQLSASESGVTQARSGYFPSISAFATYGYTTNDVISKVFDDNKALQYGISFNWRLFDGFSTNYSLQNAIVGQRNAEINLVQEERNIGVDVKKALLDLDAARKLYDVSIKAVVSAAEDRKIAEERYNLGAGTLLDLLTANASYVNAQAGKINAAYGYIFSKLNMEYAIGERTY